MNASKLIRSGLLIVVLLLTVVGQAGAQGSQPPELPPPDRPSQTTPDRTHPGEPKQDEKGMWYIEDANNPRAAVQTEIGTLSTGGPDDYGYTWSNVDFSWIDASGGTDTALTGSYADGVGPIPLPFDFKYYENTYDEIYISAYGYTTFSEPDWWDTQSRMPDPSVPNNVIAPYWAPLEVPTGSWVRYLTGGTAPERYFVVEWNQVKDAADDLDNWFTFQTILHENGDIVFQYGTIAYGSGSRYCSSAGIEDSRGLDGLTYLEFCQQWPTSNSAVRFYRPPASARVSLLPEYQSRLASSDSELDFMLDVRNTGQLGADTYNLTIDSAWPLSLYAADGITPLSDTNGDSLLDTGSVPQDGVVSIIARMQPPAGLEVGQSGQALITAHSTLDAAKTKTATLIAVVPARFAQVYMDEIDGNMRLDVVRPDVLAQVLAAENEYGYSPAIASAPGSNLVYAWSQYRQVAENFWSAEIKYALFDSSGQIVRQVAHLTDHSQSTITTYDWGPSIAIAPNGNIGVVWTRTLYDADWMANENVFFVTLAPDGNILHGPFNLTNSTSWWDDDNWNDDPNRVSFQNQRVTATDDSRFTIAWERNAGEVEYTVWDSSGSQVKAPTFLAYSWGDGVSLVSLPGNQVFMSSSLEGRVYFAVVNSAGNEVQPATFLSDEFAYYDRYPEAAQLSNGNILVAWSSSWDSGDLSFAVLNASYNVLLVPPQVVHNPTTTSRARDLSVAADGTGRAVITWVDNTWPRQNLYYALVDGSGAVLTDPIIYHHSQQGLEIVKGNGNASLFESDSAFGKISPADGAADVPLSPTLSWRPSSGAVSYEYCLGSTSSDCDLVNWINVTSNTTVGLTGLETSTTYYWQVRAVNANGSIEADDNTWWSFTTVPDAPAAFGKSTPADDASEVPLSPTLFWESSSGATSYEYCYSSVAGPCTKWNSVGSDTSVALSGLSPNYTYYWQARAVNPGGVVEADDGTWWSFTTAATPACTWPSYTAPTTPTFGDVPMDVGHWSWVERLANSTITAGCGAGNYCPFSEVVRAQMAIFLLRGKHCGSSYIPPAVGGSTGFGDVPLEATYAPWVKQLAAEGITAGCGNGNFCPLQVVNRAQMAIFLLRAKHGSTYSPPAVGASTGFGDVPLDVSYAPWVKQLAAEGITAGCGNGNFCPLQNVNRAQMATFLVRAFGLP